VRTEARKAGKESAKDFSLLNAVVSDFQTLLPSLSVGAAVKGIGAMVKQALGAADAMGKLSQKTGVSTEALSVLSIAAKTADVSFEQISGGLVQFNKTMGDLDRGSKEAGEAVRLLFGNSKALEGLNTEQRLLKVVDAIGRMESGYEKTRAAQDFFGKSGAELIPLMDDLAEGGFDRAAEKARKLGLVVGDELVEAAQKANDSIMDLKLAAEGAATQFAAGMAPAVADVSKALLDATTGEGVNGLRQIGEFAGRILKGLASVAIIVGKAVGTAVALLAEGLDDIIERVKIAKQIFTTAPWNWGSIWGAIRAKLNEQAKIAAVRRKAIIEHYQEDVLNSLEALWYPKTVAGEAKGTGEGKGKGTGGGGGEPDTAGVKARLALLKARLEQQLALSQKYMAMDEQATRIAYEQGLKGLKAYYDERRRTTAQGIDDEINTLQAKRKLALQAPVDNEAERIQRQQEVEGIDAQIQQKKLDKRMKLAELDADEAAKLLDIKKQQADIERQLLELEGKGLQATMAGIRQRAAEMKRAGLDPSLVDKLAGALEKQATFRDMQNQGALLQSQLGVTKSNIDNAQAGGQLFPFQAAEAYNAAVQRALPNMRALADEMERAATTDEERLAAAQFRAEIDSLAVSANKSAQEMANFKASVESALTSDLTNFFTRGIDEAENFGDAMRGLALSVADSLRQIAAQMLATLATEQILELFGSGGPDPGKAAAAGAAQAAPLMAAGTMMTTAGEALVAGAGAVSASAASLRAAAQMLMVANSTSAGFSSGGYVSGPGTGTSDSIPARLSNGEFVVRAAVVRQPGVLAHLIDLNQGAGALSLRSRGSVPRFAEGGLVTANEALATGASIEANFGIEEGVIVRNVRAFMKSPDGQRIQIENLRANQKRATRALGS